MRYDAKWESIINPILKDSEVELVGVVKSGDGNHAVLRIYLDKPGGITIDDISKTSREIEMVLSVEMDLENCTLEVSSPGLDRPLFTPKHFQQQIGQKVKIKLGMLKNNRKHFVGMLEAATDEAASVKIDSELFVFPYSEIDEARLVSEVNFGKGQKERGSKK
ncbi:ribosome maturation factor RimP [Candidatus Berkiella cookevillensis]|uniref:Ribosome maturation factor RimP n=1 Tax=Candidatus Berkiella cookevillensis TaxID=437022 RepID=A0A0Q9YDG7_9GAMM|nr:ribosome maturation factor RimP [Candidatus Berkiella cookevillensis]MCS5707850.1 ribosome maturation factor RimP [Candidatus Berkiella cookevillensis]